MRFRAKWSEKIEVQVNPPQKGLFGIIKTQIVEEERNGWLVGTTNVARDIQGVTYCATNYLAILPDDRDKVIFLEADIVSVQIYNL